ncbi:uncharacterized protein LOC127368577 isoform X3 [Dicentrarchus labrax]|uniref:uncharacterized protein LOC127368577 isoform X3 n=1 Tax=Dicentrarchus labrax TaxID=13489 RepID=UPI0021F55C9A|nr:uncharacterized protein LOC127368577 isoform X3 [Dicentrarchus labrax]
MVQFKWIKMSLFMILVLLFTAVTGQSSDSLIVRAGDDVTLPCENVINDHHSCVTTTWISSGSRNTVTLFENGQIHKDAMAKSDRLSVPANCSLVIKKVTVEDVGHYVCRQFISGQQQGSDSVVDLSVITMTEHKDTDKVTLSCSVSTYGRCTYTVKWLFEDKDVDNDNQDLKTSQRTCFANVTFGTAKNYKLAKCNVKDSNTGEEHQFTFSRLSAGKDSNVATTIRTVGKNPESANNDRARNSQDWWWYVLVAVGLAALLIIVVAAVSWKYKANKTQMDDNIALTSDPAVTQTAPKTSQAAADPEDGVSYASISFTKKTNSKARVLGGDEAVTYSTVRAPSSSAGASADPNSLYATIN